MLDVELVGKLAELSVGVILLGLAKMEVQVDILKVEQVKIRGGAHGVVVLRTRPRRRGVHVIHALRKALETIVVVAEDGEPFLLPLSIFFPCVLQFWNAVCEEARRLDRGVGRLAFGQGADGWGWLIEGRMVL